MGVVIGMGAAFTSDAIFFSSIRDETISPTELRFLKLGSKIVWLGLSLITISGLLILAEDPVKYLNSAKFLAKITIVFIIIINGTVFHLVHIKRFHRHASTHFPSSDEFMRSVPLLLTSGVVSTTSWLGALILGAWREVPYSYFEIMTVYFVMLLSGITLTLLFNKRFIPSF